MYKVLKNTVALGRKLNAGDIVNDLTEDQKGVLLAMGRIEKTDEVPVVEEPVEVKAETNRSVKPKRTRKAK